ncbi:MAG: insulinase family protein [Porticoccaceae bacterium]
MTGIVVLFRQVIHAFVERQYSLLRLFLCLIFITSCSIFDKSNFSGSQIAPSLIKSENDQRSYRRLTLKNDLDVLLISDPNTDKAAVALDLYMGSYQNPEQTEGLAHFLEHMLFLGTNRYPAAGEYQTFISEHGGSHNASTSLEHTNYFFSIDAAYLEDALDRFAPFFFEPTFDQKYVNRERNAVESEYQLKLKSDSRRQWDVLREIINPKHPLSKFTVGNNQTLVDSKDGLLRDQLITMYNRYYSANLMTLVVLGNHSIDELQVMVEKQFSPISNKNTVIQPYRVPLVQPDRLPLKANIKPLKELRELSLLFELPLQDSHWKVKPAMYLGEMIGYEGQGSLLKALKEKGWAESLSAGPALSDRGATLFSIDIGLTPAGYEHYEQILVELFAWLRLIQQEGIEPWRQNELAVMSDIAFRFVEKVDPADYVTMLASNMHKYSDENLLRAPYQRSKFDKRLISGLMDQLTIENMLLMVVAPEVGSDGLSGFYQTPFSVETMDKAVVEALKAANPLFDLSLVGKNPYIPSSLDLLDEAKGEKPFLLIDSAGLRLWHQKSIEFGVPKGKIIISLESEAVNGVVGYSLAELYAAYIQDQLRQTLYPAYMAGLSFSISPTREGVSIVVDGYSDKQLELLKAVLSAIRTASIDANKLMLVKQQLIRDKQNAKREYPFRQIMTHHYADIAGRYVPNEQIEILKPVLVAGVEVFVKQLLKDVRVDVLVAGNHSAQTARQVASMLEGFNLKDLASTRSVVRLAEEDRVREVFVEHNDAVLLRYIQGDSHSLKERALISLLASIISSPFYNELRTEKQLGYVVAAFPMHLNRVPGMSFIVQSPVASEDQLQEEFEGFSQYFDRSIQNLTEDGLSVHKRALLVNLEDEPENLNELTARSLKAISLGYHDFDFRERLAQSIKAVNIEDVRDAYSRLILDSPRQLWVRTAKNADVKKGVNFNDPVNEYYKFSY